jgi:predicted AAA+ superfamily ATPase
MIDRRIKSRLSFLLRHNPVVALLGPRQSGKTTLGLEIARPQRSVYLDLEDENDRAKLSDPNRYFQDHEDELVILDEVHRAPEIFQQLGGVIDRGRRRGKANGRFFLLGSAATDVLKQSDESLAGRVSYLELGPFDVLETGATTIDSLWIRGGFPRSFLAESDDLSLQWRFRTHVPRARYS